MICQECGKYWTPPVGWYLRHDRYEQICASCLEKIRKERDKKEYNK